VSAFLDLFEVDALLKCALGPASNRANRRASNPYATSSEGLQGGALCRTDEGYDNRSPLGCEWHKGQPRPRGGESLERSRCCLAAFTKRQAPVQAARAGQILRRAPNGKRALRCGTFRYPLIICEIDRRIENHLVSRRNAVADFDRRREVADLRDRAEAGDAVVNDRDALNRLPLEMIGRPSMIRSAA
jgi:hypothetical protein